jgi:hypothetical protein
MIFIQLREHFKIFPTNNIYSVLALCPMHCYMQANKQKYERIDTASQ